MRSMTAASAGPRPSAPMLVAIDPRVTLNTTDTTRPTAAMVGNDCSVRRNAKASIGVYFGALLGRRALLDPDIFRILVRQLGRIRLQPLDPGLMRHHGLVVVEEPDRR